MEGDVFIWAEDTKYIMIGYLGEVYPLEKEKFEAKYNIVDREYNKTFEYEPSVSTETGKDAFGITKYARACVAKGEGKLYAKELKKPVRVFTRWDYEKYMSGDCGDMICHAENDENDIYVIRKEVFGLIYEEVTQE